MITKSITFNLSSLKSNYYVLLLLLLLLLLIYCCCCCCLTNKRTKRLLVSLFVCLIKILLLSLLLTLHCAEIDLVSKFQDNNFTVVL